MDTLTSVGRVVAPGLVSKVVGGGALGLGAGIATNYATSGGWMGAGSAVLGTVLAGRDKKEEKRYEQQQQQQQHQKQGMWGKFMSTIGFGHKAQSQPQQYDTGYGPGYSAAPAPAPANPSSYVGQAGYGAPPNSYANYGGGYATPQYQGQAPYQYGYGRQ